MRVGLGILRMPRKEFWQLTLPEFWAIHDGVFGKQVEPMTRSRLQEMKHKEAMREAAKKAGARG